MMKLLGVNFEGQALLFPSRMYEHCHITMTDKTIIDSLHVTGHYALYDQINIGPCVVSGTVHSSSYVANASMSSSPESGPCRTFVGTFNEDTASQNNAPPPEMEEV